MQDVPTARRPHVFVIGEGMLELSKSPAGWALAYGGDTINAAVHLARFGLSVDFASALGDDPFSDELREAWRREGVNTAYVAAIVDRLPGLYAIRVDGAGERSFSYWRSASAAHAMFDPPHGQALCEAASRSDVLYFSLITLAILSEPARDALFDVCDEVRGRGGRVAFDGNYRPRLWPDATSARLARNRAIGHSDIGLPTLADEIEMGEMPDAQDVRDRWRAGGAAETVVKLGPHGCLAGDVPVPISSAVEVIDTSGAGDAVQRRLSRRATGGGGPDRRGPCRPSPRRLDDRAARRDPASRCAGSLSSVGHSFGVGRRSGTCFSAAPPLAARAPRPVPDRPAPAAPASCPRRRPPMAGRAMPLRSAR